MSGWTVAAQLHIITVRLQIKLASFCDVFLPGMNVIFRQRSFGMRDQY